MTRADWLVAPDPIGGVQRLGSFGRNMRDNIVHYPSGEEFIFYTVGDDYYLIPRRGAEKSLSRAQAAVFIHENNLHEWRLEDTDGPIPDGSFCLKGPTFQSGTVRVFLGRFLESIADDRREGITIARASELAPQPLNLNTTTS